MARGWNGCSTWSSATSASRSRPAACSLWYRGRGSGGRLSRPSETRLTFTVTVTGSGVLAHRRGGGSLDVLQHPRQQRVPLERLLEGEGEAAAPGLAGVEGGAGDDAHRRGLRGVEEPLQLLPGRLLPAELEVGEDQAEARLGQGLERRRHGVRGDGLEPVRLQKLHHHFQKVRLVLDQEQLRPAPFATHMERTLARGATGRRVPML